MTKQHWSIRLLVLIGLGLWGLLKLTLKIFAYGASNGSYESNTLHTFRVLETDRMQREMEQNGRDPFRPYGD